MTKEKLILARVRTENEKADICGDEYFSMEEEEKMLDHIWSFKKDFGVPMTDPDQSEKCGVPMTSPDRNEG